MSENNAYVTLHNGISTPEGRREAFTVSRIESHGEEIHLFFPNINGVKEIVVYADNICGIAYKSDYDDC